MGGGRPGPAHGDRHAGWLCRSVVLVEAGTARRPRLGPGSLSALNEPSQRALDAVRRLPSVGGAWCRASVGAQSVARNRYACAVLDVAGECIDPQIDLDAGAWLEMVVRR